MRRAYDVSSVRRWHQLGDGSVVLLTVAAVAGTWTRSPLAAAVLAATSLLATRRGSLMVACLLIGLVAGWRSDASWASASPRSLGAYSGWATVVGDPTPFGRGLRVTVEIGGERFDAWVYGSPRRRLVDRQSGQWVFVDGQRRRSTSNVHRAQIRHVVGLFEVKVVGDWREGSPVNRASTRVRNALRRAAESTMNADDSALFTGLVIGDDSRQPASMTTEFRASGLSHLTAVSGQNVAFVIAAASPLLRRLRPWWRWATTVGLIAWFMALTRFEPSVLRAGLMAMLACSSFVLGRQQSVVRLLAWTVTILVLVDPMLVWSVGFWLSTGATAGVCVVAPWLSTRLPGPPWLTAPLAVTLGAQVGVALPSVVVFHRLPLVSLPANLLAVPVAGFVMLWGIPAGLLAATVPPIAPVVMAPCVVGTRWVSTVAALASRLEPSPRWSVIGWVTVVATVCFVMIRRRWRRPPADVPV